MKRIAAALVALTLIAGIASGCAADKIPAGDGEGKLSVVCTVFPEYDWARRIMGDTDGAALTLLISNGVDLHSYQPTAQDMITIAGADILVYIGGESDKWVTDALEGAVNQNMRVINLIDILGDAVHEEELTQGMQADEADAGSGAEYDEHVWLSLKNAMLFSKAIADALIGLDPENAEAYRANLDSYTDELSALDGEYRSAAASAAHGTLVFGDRFPFRYLLEDYGIGYFAAFPGCSAETEASFETVAFLASKVDELGLDVILTTENPASRIASTIAENTASGSMRILALDSMQSVTDERINAGETYLSIMENNLAVLREALG